MSLISKCGPRHLPPTTAKAITSIRQTETLYGKPTRAILLEPGNRRQMHRSEWACTNAAAEDKLPKGRSARKTPGAMYFSQHLKWVKPLHSPIEKLLSHDVSIIVRQKVDPAVLKPQMLQKRLHDAGLLEDGVVVWSLGEGSQTHGMQSGVQICLRPDPSISPTPVPQHGPIQKLLTGLSLKPKPRKSRAITRWNLSVRPSQI